MKLPNKIGILDTTQSTDTRLRFDQWEGFDPKMQVKQLALKVNEILDFLEGHPAVANEFGGKLKREGEAVVHDHDWHLNMRLGTRGFYECKGCGETLEKYIPPTMA